MKLRSARKYRTEHGSLPARGVWIEIISEMEMYMPKIKVTPRTGSVD